MAVLSVYRGEPADKLTWSELFWVDEDTSGEMVTKAIRKRRSDKQWYITDRLMAALVILHGPFGSMEAAEMLLRAGALEEE